MEKVEDVRVILARIEEKLDSQQMLCGERRGHVNARLESVIESQRLQGERIGRLESAEEHRAGQMKAFAAVLTVVFSLVSFACNWLLKALGSGI